MNYDVVVVGGGIIGFSAALQLLQRDQSLSVAVLEKEAAPARHQTGRNSGVIHAGVYYAPGSLKSKFCSSGCVAIKNFCREHSIAFSEPGKLIVAATEDELGRMADLSARCVENGLSVETLSAAETQRRQPGVNAAGSFWVKETGIVDFKQVCLKYAELFQALGGAIHYEQVVSGVTESQNEVTVRTRCGQSFSAGNVVTCSGLHADRMVRMCGLQPRFKIVPFRGEYFRLREKYDGYFRHLIYPVPDPALPFLGVHFTPQMAGFSTVGPSAVLALAREGYDWGEFSLRDCVELAFFPPVWRVLFGHFSATVNELRGSLFKGYYLKLLHKYFSEIEKSDLLPYPAGVRAQAVSSDGGLIEDFLFVSSDRILHVCNAPSPAATSSLPIGKHIVNLFMEKFDGALPASAYEARA